MSVKNLLCAKMRKDIASSLKKVGLFKRDYFVSSLTVKILRMTLVGIELFSEFSDLILNGNSSKFVECLCLCFK